MQEHSFVVAVGHQDMAWSMAFPHWESMRLMEVGQDSRVAGGSEGAGSAAPL